MARLNRGAKGPRVRMQVTGLREMQRVLQTLPDELQVDKVTEALMYAGEPMRDEAKALAPDAEPVGQGLPDNIIVSDKLTDSQQVTEGARKQDQARAYVGVDGAKPGIAPHGILQEFGTGPRYHESGKFVGATPAHPFMRPAFDSKAREAIQRFALKLKAIIEPAARRLARR